MTKQNVFAEGKSVKPATSTRKLTKDEEEDRRSGVTEKATIPLHFTIKDSKYENYLLLATNQHKEYLNIAVGRGAKEGAKEVYIRHSFSPESLKTLRDKLNELYPVRISSDILKEIQHAVATQVPPKNRAKKNRKQEASKKGTAKKT